MIPLSVAHVVLSLETGGQERVVAELAVAQRAMGHAVTAVALTPNLEGEIPQRLREHGVRLIGLDKRGLDPTLCPKLVAVFFRNRIELVHTHNPSPLIYGAPAAKLARARVVHTKHGEHHDSDARLALRRTAARFCDAFVAVSGPTAEFARERRECAPHKLRVIRNGTDLSRFGRDPEARRRVRDELRIASDAWVIGSIGRYVPEKDQSMLIRAAEPLLGERTVLMMAGGGKMESEVLAAAAASPARDFIRVLGKRTDVPALLAAMDVYAISSRTEGLPIALIEAMASELAVVSTAVGGIPGVIADGQTGLLVGPSDELALTAALRQLRDRPQEARALATAASRAARAAFTSERMNEEYMALYARVLGRS